MDVTNLFCLGTCFVSFSENTSNERSPPRSFTCIKYLQYFPPFLRSCFSFRLIGLSYTVFLLMKIYLTNFCPGETPLTWPGSLDWLTSSLGIRIHSLLVSSCFLVTHVYGTIPWLHTLPRPSCHSPLSTGSRQIRFRFRNLKRIHCTLYPSVTS